MKRLAPVTGLLLAIATSTRAEAPPATPVTVPFALLKPKHMVVHIKVNGKGPYRVIFDTGAPVMLLNNKIAKDSGVLPKNFKPSAFQLFGTAGQFPRPRRCSPPRRSGASSSTRMPAMRTREYRSRRYGPAAPRRQRGSRQATGC
jgi:hypothetical protein